MSAVKLRGNQRIVYDLLVAAAAAGAPAPSNSDIADSLGCAHHSDGSDVVRQLERRGLIDVERRASSRTITITASGQSIHSPPPNVRARAPADDSYRGPVPVAQLVDRDPCPRCGVRADLGCGCPHTAARFATAMSL